MSATKNIRVAIFGPPHSGKTTLLSALRCMYGDRLRAPLERESYTTGYTPTAMCECSRISIPAMFMDIEFWDTSGSEAMMSVYRRFFHFSRDFRDSARSNNEVDVALVVVDSGSTDVASFDVWYQLARLVAVQQSVVVINRYNNPKQDILKRREPPFTEIETHCIKQNLYHVQLDVQKECRLILDLIQVHMFSNAEFGWMRASRGESSISDDEYSVGVPGRGMSPFGTAPSSFFTTSFREHLPHIGSLWVNPFVGGGCVGVRGGNGGTSIQTLRPKSKSWPIARVDSRNELCERSSGSDTE